MLISAHSEKKFAGVLSHDHHDFFVRALCHVRPEDVVLDCGAGDGTFGFLCEPLCKEVHLAEGNPESVAFLKQRFPNVKECRFPNLPWPDQFFDVIHCSHVVEHLQPQELYDFMVSMDRCLKPGGRLMLSYPLLWDGFYHDLSHVRPYPSEVFIKYLGHRSVASTTRSLISGDYHIVEKIVRYAEKKPMVLVAGEGFWPTVIRKVARALSLWLKNNDVSFVVETGETLILKKEPSSTPPAGV